MENSLENKYAVVGMGGIFPDAADLQKFWNNIINNHVSIGPVPHELFDRKIFYRPEVYGKSDKNNKSYTDISAILKSIDFDPMQFKINPMAAKQMDDNQKVSLLSAKQALAGGALDSVAKDKISVFMGNTFVGKRNDDFLRTFACDRFEYYLRDNETLRQSITQENLDTVIDEIRQKTFSNTFTVTEDTTTGILPNIIAARICSVFDFHGHAFVIDAACASALAAIICGIQQLKSRESDAVICGAVDILPGEPGLIYFSGINALSPDGSFPFDARANGFVIGHGGGVVILKRLADAMKSEDKIYAVVTGYGKASDGKGKAIAAPNDIWQAKTIKMAYEMAGYPIETVEYIEAHGTSTQVGDASEVTALKTCFKELGAIKKGFCALSSVKSNIGHLKSAAGIPSFIKAVLSICNKKIPPIANFRTENPKLQLADSPFYITPEVKDWTEKEHPRRAGVSAFGFGGADYHIALEEFRSKDYQGISSNIFASVEIPHKPSFAEYKNSYNLAFFSSDNLEELANEIDSFRVNLQTSPENFTEIIYTQNILTESSKKYRFALTFESIESFVEKSDLFKKVFETPEKVSQLSAKGIYYNSEFPLSNDQLAFLFPGQGSQYPDMVLDILNCYYPARNLFSKADALWKRLNGTAVSELIDSSTRGKEDTERLLKDTQNTHPSVLVSSLALHGILKEMNVEPAVMIGHSLGEISALCASGKISFREVMRLIDLRSRSFKEVPEGSCGAMAALKMNKADTFKLISEVNLTLTVANTNSYNQTIVSGDVTQIESLISFCNREKIGITRLNVSHAFHSPLMLAAQEMFGKNLQGINFNESQTDVVANEISAYYGQPAQEIRDRLSTQICGPVNFADSIEMLYSKGIRIFVELGPGNVLTNFTNNILEKKNVKVLSSNSKNISAVESFNRMLCGLFTAGINIDLIPQISDDKPRIAQRHVSVNSDSYEKQTFNKVIQEKIVYSGVSVGLPGSFKKSFRDDNFRQLFEGRNQIERLTDGEREKLAELRVSKLIKSVTGANFEILDTINQVIQLAGKFGQIDMLNDYCLDEKDVKLMSSGIAHAIAAGYEALRDSQIPLVHEYSQTSSGSILPVKWALPQEMQRETGVIFANSFPLIETVITEVSNHVSYKFSTKTKGEIFDFYDSLIQKIDNQESRKILTDWFTLNYARLSLNPSDKEIYKFNHHFMNQISLQANNYLAKFINAGGPNFQINAACSSAATAVTLAEEMIKSGRVKRMIIIGSDDACSEKSMPYIGAGFLSTGACSNGSDLYETAVPFDRRRNGMIMGAGAIGIVIEAESECKRRGVVPICELMGTHCFNTAGHHSQLDVPRYAEELEFFISKMEKEHSFNRKSIASELLYMSHETYTPARGGCAESEAVSLKHVFKEDLKKIVITNTKGMTGHTMGASIEDVTASKALQYSKMPPVVNFREPDEALEGLNLSKGGEHNCSYALRMAAGFGSQGNYILLRKIADQDQRISDQQTYNRWLSQVSGIEKPELQLRGKTLVVKDSVPGKVIVRKSKIDCWSRYNPQPASEEQSSRKQSDGTNNRREGIPLDKIVNNSGTDKGSIKSSVLSIISKVSGYSEDMLEPEMEIEADLGVDTVKQATILSMLGEKFGISSDEGFRISDFPTIAKLIEFFGNRFTANMNSHSEFHHVDTTQETVKNDSKSETFSEVCKVISEVTGYSIDMLEPQMEIEADLGVDTVKQATILALLGEKLGIPPEDGFRISDFPTIGKMVDNFSNLLSNQNVKKISGDNTGRPVQAQVLSLNENTMSQAVINVISEVTGYSIDMLEPEMELEADLGVDTVKQATILAMLGEKFGINKDAGFMISDFPTIKQIVRFFSEKSIVNANVTKHNAEIPAESVTAEITSGKHGNLQFSVRDLITDIFTQNTSYPPEMIEPDLSIINDLQLTEQCINKVQNAIISTFKLEKNWRIPDDALIGDIIDFISNSTENGKIPEDLKAHVCLARQTLDLKDAPVGIKKFSLVDKSVWIIGDEKNIVESIKSELSSKVNFTCEFLFPLSQLTKENVAKFLEIYTKNPADIIIDTTCCGTDELITGIDADKAYSIIDRASDSRFVFYKSLQEQNLFPERILGLITVDGYFGLSKENKKTVNPVFGLYNGFYKALRKEWKNTRISILDLDPAVLLSTSNVVKLLVNELESDSSGVEICYPENKRKIVVVEDRPLHADLRKSIRFDSNDVVVVTGGGSGITSKIILQLGKNFQTNFVIIGRTVLVENVEQFVKMSEEELNKQKESIRNFLKAKTGRVTPVQVEREFGRILKSIEIYRTLKDLKQYGCKVQYVSADVCDLKQMKLVLDETRNIFGPVTAIIHGAGIEISHLMEKKSPDEFHLVQSIKTYGACNLSLLCKNDPLKSVTALSSISGLFGNAAQLDYSAANCFLNFWARMYSRNGVAAKSLIWSGWKETGMAWRNSFVKENSEAMGINLIEPDYASLAAVQEICINPDTDIVLHNGLGVMVDPQMCSVDLSMFPMIDWVEYGESGIKAVHRRFSVQRDEFLNQHRLGNTPIMPGVGFMEAMAEAYSLVSEQDSGRRIFRNLEFTDAFKLYHEKSRDMKLEVLELNSTVFTMKVVSRLNSANNISNVERLYCKADVSSDRADVSDFNVAQWDLQLTEKGNLADLMKIGQKFPININLGPFFMDIFRQNRSEGDCVVEWSDKGLFMIVEFPKAQINNPGYPLNKFLLNPSFLDTMHQAGAICSLVMKDQVYLPFGAEEFGILKTPNIDGQYQVFVKVNKTEGDKIFYNLALLDLNGELFCYAKNSVFHRINQ